MAYMAEPVSEYDSLWREPLESAGGHLKVMGELHEENRSAAYELRVGIFPLTIYSYLQ